MLGIYIILIALVLVLIGNARAMSARHAQPDGRTDTASQDDTSLYDSYVGPHLAPAIRMDPVSADLGRDWDIANPLSHHYRLDDEMPPYDWNADSRNADFLPVEHQWVPEDTSASFEPFEW